VQILTFRSGDKKRLSSGTTACSIDFSSSGELLLIAYDRLVAVIYDLGDLENPTFTPILTLEPNQQLPQFSGKKRFFLPAFDRMIMDPSPEHRLVAGLVRLCDMPEYLGVWIYDLESGPDLVDHIPTSCWVMDIKFNDNGTKLSIIGKTEAFIWDVSSLRQEATAIDRPVWVHRFPVGRGHAGNSSRLLSTQRRPAS
jgi:hypothetical protein